MAYYVEYLRALRALRIVAIVLGVLLLLALLARLSWGKPTIREDYVSAMEHSRTAHVTRKALPDGRSRTVIDDPTRGTHAVVERRGQTITSLEITEPHAARGGAHHREGPGEIVRMSPPPGADAGTAMSTSTTTTGTTTMWTASYTFFEVGVLFSMAIPMGLLAATMLAGPLAKENNGHLELAWTKPVSREKYALSAVLVDVSAVVVAQIATVVAVLLGTLLWDVPKISFESVAAARIAFALLAPIAWYACLTAFSASIKRGPGTVLGIGWVAAVICPWIASGARGASTTIGRAVYALFNAVSYLDPFAYIWFKIDTVATDPARTTVIAVLALAALAIAYLGVAVLQWRRVEA